MTEHNLFCYSEQYNDKNSIRQEPYRIFNKQVTKERYYDVLHLIRHDIFKDLTLELTVNSSWKSEWEKVTTEQWKRILQIPEAVGFKKGLEFITGTTIDVEDVEIDNKPKTVIEHRMRLLEE